MHYEKLRTRHIGIDQFLFIYRMLIGTIGIGLIPKRVFGLFEWFSTFSVVVFNAVPGMYLFAGKLEKKEGRIVQ